MLHILGLVFALVLSSQGAAFAAAKGDAIGKTAICTGFGTHVIFLDENGEQTTPPQLCADAFKSFVALTSADPVVAAPAPASLDMLVARYSNQSDAAFIQNYTARGPPDPV